MVKSVFQVLLAIFGTVAVITGLWGIITGALDKEYAVSFAKNNLILDNNLRYFSGLWLGIGIGLFLIIPKIENNRAVLVYICLSIFTGGIGRVISIIQVGYPSILYVIFTVLELLFPLLILLHKKIYKQ
jgi:hypothetical protein